MDGHGGFWERERQRLTGCPARIDYRELEPTKWAALLRLRDAVLAHTEKCGYAVHDSLELGCGAATLSIQLASRGVTAIAIDRDPEALRFAGEIASSVSAANTIHSREEDFLSPACPDDQADLVFSGGVLEHYTEPKLGDAYRRHRAATRKWILIGAPNYSSSVFRSFLSWASRTGNLYHDPHLDIDIEGLAAEHGDSVHWSDGCHVVLGAARYIDRHNPALADHYEIVRRRLLALGGPVEFPLVDFTQADIPLLVELEGCIGKQRRLDHGFMRWWLIERGP
jgi:hypothetical protein